jgi:hypothetical protein
MFSVSKLRLLNQINVDFDQRRNYRIVAAKPEVLLSHFAVASVPVIYFLGHRCCEFKHHVV